MIKVGMTGGIGSGKTTVSHIFKLFGVPVFNADNEARFLQNEDWDTQQQIKELFGNQIYSTDGKLNRSALAQVVFGNKALLTQLNGIIHPKVHKRFQNWTDSNHNAVYGLYEAAILFESGFCHELDFNMLVISPVNQRTQRVMARDGITADELSARMSNQMSDEMKSRLASLIIYNDEKHSLIQQVIDIDHKLRENGKIW